MRIIAGELRGRRLNTPNDNSVRPTLDAVREALFNILSKDIAGANVLDLFAGTGALGIEAISRGADKAYFCDADNDAYKLLQSNLALCEKERYQSFRGDYGDFLRKLSNEGAKFDIVFCDPPYKLQLGNEIAKRLLDFGVIKPEGILVVERETRDKETEAEGFNKISSRKYGSVSIDILQAKSSAALTGVFDPFTNGHRYLVERALKDFSFVNVVILINPEKKNLFDVKKRLEMLEAELSSFKKRASVSFFEGLAVDYLRERGIRYIIRGIRNEKDFSYEREMAEWNFKHGNARTVFYIAEDTNLSSTLVREEFLKGRDCGRYVSEIVKLHMNESRP